MKGFTGTPQVVTYATVNLAILLKNRPYVWSAKVGFIQGRDGEALWGHIGFLQYFNASFHGPERHFTLRPKADFPRLMSLP